jgi:cell division protein FtsI (penicillin-binding protein 3)
VNEGWLKNNMQLSIIKRRRSYNLNETAEAKNGKRIDYLLITTVVLTILIIGRLIQLQIFSHNFYNQLAISQYNNLSIVPAKRGKISLKNKNGQIIDVAINRTLDMVYVDPKVLEDKEEAALKLSPILEMSEQEILDKINKKYKDYVRLVINPDPVLTSQIKKLDLDGIYLKSEYDYILEEIQYEDEDIQEAKLSELSDKDKELSKSKFIEIAADPTEIKDIEKTAEILAEVLDGYTKKNLIATLSLKELRYVRLKQRLNMDQSDEIKQLNIYGVVLVPEDWRFYPEQELAAQILGFVDKQGVGQYGIEGQYNTALKGVNGERKIDLDIRGNPIAVGDDQMIKPVINGTDFILTLDRSIQSQTEKLLAENVRRHGADNGQVVIMEPKSGAILAMANYPTFNPNEFFQIFAKDPITDEYLNKIGPKVFQNRAIQDAYEFGSTFKVLTVAAALDSGDMNITDTVCDNTGEVTIDDFIIRNSDLVSHNCMTLSNILEKSSNIGALRVGLKLGAGVFRNYIIDFGIGEYTDIGFNVENNGYLGPLKEWGKVKTANASFGQGITGSATQLVRAVSAVANQGKIVQPYIIEEMIIDGKSEKRTPHEIRRVIQPNTAAKIIQMMVSAVDNGVAKSAKVDGWSVAAKTGTAQVAEVGGYSTEKYIASIVGFAPASDPKFVMLVKINHPKTSKFGAEVAAPLFRELSEYVLKYLEVPKDR